MPESWYHRLGLPFKVKNQRCWGVREIELLDSLEEIVIRTRGADLDSAAAVAFIEGNIEAVQELESRFVERIWGERTIAAVPGDLTAINKTGMTGSERIHAARAYHGRDGRVSRSLNQGRSHPLSYDMFRTLRGKGVIYPAQRGNWLRAIDVIRTGIGTVRVESVPSLHGRESVHDLGGEAESGVSVDTETRGDSGFDWVQDRVAAQPDARVRHFAQLFYKALSGFDGPTQMNEILSLARRDDSSIPSGGGHRQVRAAVAVLVECGLVERLGKAQWTRYRALERTEQTEH